MKRIFAFLLSILLGFGSTVPSAYAVTAQTEAAESTAKLALPCRSAILIEQTTGQVLYEANADERLPIASVTKIMTLLLVMEALEAGTVHLEDQVPISELAASMGGSQVYLEPGESITLEEVLKAVFVASANDGAVALAELISGSVEGFVAAMNERARALGMHDTVFYNPTGLDDVETGLSTARDVATMSAALLRHEKIYDWSTIWIDSIRGGAFGLSNTNKLVRFYPGATGLKTGSTAKAKYCISASAERNGLKLCAVVLAGESSQDRFQSAKTLLDHGFANYAYYSPEDISPEPVKVWGGVKERVGVSIPKEGFLLPKNQSVGLVPEIQLASEVQAPVEKGQSLGKILYKKDGQVIREMPLLAEDSVEALGYWDVFCILVRHFFAGI
ncbi:MAG: D-alanyl-D-alanine carboxypeptidase [Clostridia bacterium]|nr:D-alanyl-D-alanine carboxypeptidase [Clostridia bacterium]